MSTTDFIRRYTTEGGTFLKWDRKGVCVFLDSNGCGVHPARPLVCRLYPLGRHVRSSGEESFSEIEPDPECKGVYAKDSMIMDYLESQGAGLFMKAADRYLALFWKLQNVLQKGSSDPETHEAIVNVFQDAPAGSKAVDCQLTDMDATVTAYCGKSKIPFPKDPEEKMLLHIQALEAWANNIGRRII
jgi:hypothetical protein